MLGTSGNLSVVTGDGPLRFHVTASGRDKGCLTPADFIEVDADGAPFDERRPSAETLVHAEIYRRTDAGAVFHVHQVFGALCSTRDEAQGELVLRDIEMIKGIGLWGPDDVARIPIVPNHADIPQLSRATGEALRGDIPGVLICRHGLYAWGRDAFAARRHVEIFGYLFEYSWRLSSAQR